MGKEERGEDSTSSRHSGEKSQLKTACLQRRSQKNLKAETEITCGHLVEREEVYHASRVSKASISKARQNHRYSSYSVMGGQETILSLFYFRKSRSIEQTLQRFFFNDMFKF